MKAVYILGINSAFHEPAACLIKNGKIIAAVEEERFNRIRHGKFVLADSPHELPFSSINYCLKAAGITLKEVDYIGFSFNPEERLEKNSNLNIEAIPGELGSKDGEKKFYNLLMKIPSLLEEHYGVPVKDKFFWVPHHLCHCASAFYASPYQEAAILSTDGIGEFTTIMFAKGQNNKIEVIKEIGYPNSLGFLWTKASQYLSLTVSGRAEYGAGKVMALAAYGSPNRFYDQFRSFVAWDEEGNFSVDEKIAQFRSGSLQGFETVFGKQREARQPFEQRHMDFAAALQKITNEALLAFANFLHKKTKLKNLCSAGGVTLNCVANTYVLENSSFERMFVEPAANDMGTALGAAYYVWYHILSKPRDKENYLGHVYLGTKYSNEQIKKALENPKKIKYEKISNIEETIAYLLAKGLVVGWFQGRMEFGPRALGNKSILADPRNPNLYKKVSMKIKGREFFRPLAPSILKEHADEWFYRPKNGSDSDQFMIFSYKLRDEKLGLVPAITHVDNSGRLQVVDKKSNKRFHNLIKKFYELTGVPILINTSFNTGEPIVENPEQAINTFLNSKIDVLAIGDYVVFKKDNDKKCFLFESKGKVISIKEFVENNLNNVSLSDYEKSILSSAEFSDAIPSFARRVRVMNELFSKSKRDAIKVERSGERSAFWKSKGIKFKGCNPQPKEHPFPTKSFFFGKERETEGFRPFGVLTKEQVMREILGWAFFSLNNLGQHQRPIAVYDYGDDIGYCLVFESKGDKRIENLFDFHGITLADMVSHTKKVSALPKEVGIKGIDVSGYIEKKSSLLAEMNFKGGFRDLLNSNIGNDFLVNKEPYVNDFDSFRIVEIPEKPDDEFLRRFCLQCFVEAIKSSLPLIDHIHNDEGIESYLKESSLYQAYRKKFYAFAKKKGWDISKLKQIEKRVVSTPIFRKEAKKMVPPSIHGMFNSLPSEELTYKIH